MAAAYGRGQGVDRSTCRAGTTVPEGHAKVKSVANPLGTRSPKSKFSANTLPFRHPPIELAGGGRIG